MRSGDSHSSPLTHTLAQKVEQVVLNIRFSQIKEMIGLTPGLYEVYTNDGIALKVGIAKDLRSRLTAHGESKQSRLKVKDARKSIEPQNIESKKSILTKHLYFDSEISKKYDLTTEFGRQEFLQNECYIVVKTTNTREEARELEKDLEVSGKYRYVGLVIRR